uniref:Uncharacterized protein n=1 Tax=Rhizophora mucronata TaxID=61149 RepID=A0A2P2NAE1_RHIMU
MLRWHQPLSLLSYLLSTNLYFLSS